MYVSPPLRVLDKLYRAFVLVGSNLQSLFLFWMRVTWGHQFFLAGSSKLAAIAATAASFAALQIPVPLFHAYLVAYTEAIGGILLMFGLLTRVAAIPLIITMVFAFKLAHAEVFTDLRFLTEPLALVGQPPYPFLITSLLVFIFGPGRISIDALIKRWAERQEKF
jgi:putative oxidoreductase